MTKFSIIDREAAHFGAMAGDWWDPKGASAMLHKLNPVRLAYIRDMIDMHWQSDEHGFRPLEGKTALDVGCGAGLLAEPLARMGAKVTAVDAAPSTATLERVLAPLRNGRDAGLLSDAGCPGVADPGAALVAAAHAAKVRVVPLVGPSAVLLALMASGLNGQRFAFHGYLPVKPDARIQALRTLEQSSRTHSRTELFIETPYRNASMLDAMAATLKPRTQVCVAADLTLATETIECRPASQWRDQDHARFDRRPAIFLLLA